MDVVLRPNAVRHRDERNYNNNRIEVNPPFFVSTVHKISWFSYSAALSGLRFLDDLEILYPSCLVRKETQRTFSLLKTFTHGDIPPKNVIANIYIYIYIDGN